MKLTLYVHVYVYIQCLFCGLGILCPISIPIMHIL